MDYRALDEMELESRPSPVVRQDFRVFIAEEAFDRIGEKADATREVGGILVGEVLRDEGGPYILVETVIEALHAEESGTELTLTHATWNHIHEQMDKVHQGKRILGWYHTHPNFGIFLSDKDRFVQQSFFDLPFQIALVYDPVRREHGIYTWRDNMPWRARRYWIGTNEHTWDGPRDAPERVAHERQAAPQREQETAAPAPVGPQSFGEAIGSTWVIAAAVAGLLLGFALGSRLGARPQAQDQQVQTVQEAVASLNTDLLAVIRGALSDEAFARSFDEGVARLDSAAESLKSADASNPAMKSALQSVLDAQQALSRVRQDRQVAREMIQQIEHITKENRSPEYISRDLAAQRASLGDIYVELARGALSSGNGARVKELLNAAAALDPDRHARYEEQLKEFTERGTLTQPDAGKDQPAQSATPQSQAPAQRP